MSPSTKKESQSCVRKEPFSMLYVHGNASVDDIDDFIDVWHQGGTGVPLHEFLGLSQEEYAQWVEQPDSLEATLNKKRHKHSSIISPSSTAQRASNLLKQICDPTRLQVLLMLAEGESHVAALCSDLEQSQSAISHHLALLRHGGLIASRRQGKQQVYALTEIGEQLVKVVTTLVE